MKFNLSIHLQCLDIYFYLLMFLNDKNLYYRPLHVSVIYTKNILHMQEFDIQIFRVLALLMDTFLKWKPHDEINSESATETEEIV